VGLRENPAMTHDATAPLSQKLVDEIARSVARVRHGYVQLIVQDSKVIQIDVLDRLRLDKKPG
jgi:hypothetical protein